MKRSKTSIAIFSLLTIAVFSDQSTAGTPNVDLPNFARVSEKLYRGAQPTALGFKRLKQLGVRTVINLRGEDELAVAEKAAVEQAGLRYFNVGLPGLRAPSHEQVARVMSVIDDPENAPVFIHCRRGSDRTGTIIALYRMSREGWTADQALHEAKRYGLSRVQIGMKRYISNYEERRAKSRRASTAPGDSLLFAK